VTLSAGRRARRALKRRGRVRTSVSITLAGESGGQATQSLDLTVEAGGGRRMG
jgi:hypothetical protein